MVAYALSPPGEQFIMVDEHFESVVYNKDGHPTGAWGHTGTWADGSPLVVGQVVPRAVGVTWFRGDVREAVGALEKKSDECGLILNQGQVDALTSLLFNAGTGLLESKHSLGAAFDACDIDAVGKSILLYRMATVNGVRGPWLQKRREAEYVMFVGTGTTATAAVSPNHTPETQMPSATDSSADEVCVATPPETEPTA